MQIIKTSCSNEHEEVIEHVEFRKIKICFYGTRSSAVGVNVISKQIISYPPSLGAGATLMRTPGQGAVATFTICC